MTKSIEHSKPAAMRTITFDEWILEGKKRFGDNQDDWRFICPACGHVAKVSDWRAAGAGTAIAFSCIGRYIAGGPKRRAFGGSGPGPCDYAGGGLFRIAPVTVTVPGEDPHLLFEFDLWSQA